MGMHTEFFKMPVCNSFRPKIFYNQLCYEVDVNQLIERDYFSANELRLGLSILVDTNYNRQYSLKDRKSKTSLTETMGKSFRYTESDSTLIKC